MTDHNEKSVNTLERALLNGYHSQSRVSHTVDVTHDVMRTIRRSATEGSRWTPAAVLDQLVWRTATITAAVVLTAAVLTVGLWRPPTGESPTVVAEELEAVPFFGE